MFVQIHFNTNSAQHFYSSGQVQTTVFYKWPNNSVELITQIVVNFTSVLLTNRQIKQVHCKIATYKYFYSTDQVRITEVVPAK